MSFKTKIKFLARSFMPAKNVANFKSISHEVNAIYKDFACFIARLKEKKDAINLDF